MAEPHSPDLWLPAASRLASLHAVALRLTVASTRTAIAEALLPVCISVPGAASALLAVAPPGLEALAGPTLTISGAVGASPRLLAALESTPGWMTPLAAALEQQGPAWLGSHEEANARYPALATALRESGLEAVAVVPLRVAGQALGILLVAYAARQSFPTEERLYLETLALQAAAALDRLRHTEATQRQSARMQALAIANAQLDASAAQARAAAERAASHTMRLQDWTAALAEALTPAAVMELVAAQVSQLVGLTNGVIGLVSADGRELELVQMSGYREGELQQWQRQPLEAVSPGPDVVRSGVAQFWESRAKLLARYPQLAEAPLRSESWALVPLRAEGRTLGVLSLGFTAPHSFNSDERGLLELLAQQCATALQRTERYQAVEQAWAAAEEAAERTTRLYAVTAALAEALTLTDVADVIVTQGMAALGAIAGSVRHISPEGDALITLQVIGYPPGLAELWQTIPLDAPVPMAEVVRIARPILIESEQELATVWPQFVEAMEALRYHAVALLPLMVAGRPIGTISFGFDTPRSFNADDRGFLDALARQCALALERARLYAATQTQAARLGALAEASQLFAAASLDLSSVLDAIAWRVTVAIGDLGVVGLLSDDRRTLRLAAIAHANAEAQEIMSQLLRSFPLDADEGISSKTLRTGQPQLLATISEEHLRGLIKPEYWPYLDRFGIYSLMVVALRVNGEVIGTLGALRDSPGRPYTGGDLTMLQELADRAALAVANARLYQQAREAIQVRDQFLSIAAHELKTPLTALSGQAQLAQRRLDRGEQSPERLARSINVIVRQAERLDAMVRTLLDVGRLERGQFALERQLVDLVALIARVIDEVQPDLERHTLRYEQDVPALFIDGDPLRLEQVFQNLVSNAVKYSPYGGTIIVRVTRVGTTASITVADEGVGIPTEALPQLFQRFYRAPNVALHRISGMGIGLYVVREIVARHGGSVDVTSTEGIGSIFTVGLPAADHPPGGI